MIKSFLVGEFNLHIVEISDRSSELGLHALLAGCFISHEIIVGLDSVVLRFSSDVLILISWVFLRDFLG